MCPLGPRPLKAPLMTMHPFMAISAGRGCSVVFLHQLVAPPWTARQARLCGFVAYYRRLSLRRRWQFSAASVPAVA